MSTRVVRRTWFVPGSVLEARLNPAPSTALAQYRRSCVCADVAAEHCRTSISASTRLGVALRRFGPWQTGSWLHDDGFADSHSARMA